MTSPRDQISKASRVLLESIKDSVVSNVVTATQTGQLNLKNINLNRLLMILDASVEAGHQRAHKSFLLEVDKALTSAAPSAQTKKKPT